MKLNNMKSAPTVFRCGTSVLLLVCLFACGCSDKAIVTGKVTYSDNGEPVQTGMVVFSSDKELGRAAIKNGYYSAGLLKDGEGLPPGNYQVSAENASSPIASAMAQTVDMYGNRSTIDAGSVESYYTKEPQTIEVKKSMTYDFTVERGTRPITGR